MTQQQDLLTRMKDAVQNGDEPAAVALAQQALQSDLPALTAIEEGFVAGIRKAGDLWEEGEFFLPELVTAAQAMKAAMAVILPALEEGAGVRSAGRVIIGTIEGDIHDIGKTLVATMLSANGFEVSDEGAEVPVDRFVRRAEELDADLVCASALLTTTMILQRNLVQAVGEAGLRARVMVGGAPVTRAWAAEIGAHGYADSAVAAVKEARALVPR